MDIKEYLNEKLKDNKVAEKAKKVTAATLVAGTLLTGLAGCEKKVETIDNVKDVIEERLQKSISDFELDNIQAIKAGDKYSVTLQDTYENYWSALPPKPNKTVFTYEISENAFNKIYDLANEYNDNATVHFVEYNKGDAKYVTINLDRKAIKEHKDLVTLVYNQVKDLEPSVSEYANPSETISNVKEVIEEKLQEDIADFELNNIQAIQADDKYSIALQDTYEDYWSALPPKPSKTVFTYEVSEDVFNKIYNIASRYNDNATVHFVEYSKGDAKYVTINLDNKAIREHKDLVSYIYNQVKDLEPSIAEYANPNVEQER